MRLSLNVLESLIRTCGAALGSQLAVYNRLIIADKRWVGGLLESIPEVIKDIRLAVGIEDH